MDEAASDAQMPRLESYPGGESAPASADNAEGPGRRRRRRGGRGGERGERPDRGEGGERAPRESLATEDGSPSDNIGNRAAQGEDAREHVHHHDAAAERTGDRESMYDPRNEPAEETKREPADEPRHEPRHVYTQAPAPVAFKAVIQHDDSDEADAHRPQRKRRHGSESNEPQPLQLVETQVEAAPLPVEDELPRRSKPRRRRSGSVEAEPLKLVETQPNAESQRQEIPPTP